MDKVCMGREGEESRVYGVSGELQNHVHNNNRHYSAAVVSAVSVYFSVQEELHGRAERV
jgi:hypothetical protein